MRTPQRGSILIFGAWLILFLAAFAMLAVDVGRVLVVRNELQSVADAAALAGANCLTRQSSPASSVNCTTTTSVFFNWDRARAKAADFLSYNNAAESPISSTDAGHLIQAGYWFLGSDSQAAGPTGGSFSTTITPGPNDRPAISVTVRKEDGVNNGPVSLLTRVFGGLQSVAVQASAVAVISAPSTVLPGNLIPVAINKCMFDLYWDSATNSPKTATTTTLTYTSQNKTYTIPQVIGQPWQIRIGSGYHYDTCDSGQWTSFDQNVNDLPAIRELINNGNPTELSLDQSIWIEPGTKSAAYDTLDAKYPTPPGADVTVVVVDRPPPSDLSQLGTAPLYAFAGFHIDEIDKNNKYIEGHFIRANVTSGSGMGPSYGAYTPPRLAR